MARIARKTYRSISSPRILPTFIHSFKDERSHVWRSFLSRDLFRRVVRIVNGERVSREVQCRLGERIVSRLSFLLFLSFFPRLTQPLLRDEGMSLDNDNRVTRESCQECSTLEEGRKARAISRRTKRFRGISFDRIEVFTRKKKLILSI